MSLSMYQASVPVFIRQLGNLSTILGLAATDAETRNTPRGSAWSAPTTASASAIIR